MKDKEKLIEEMARDLEKIESKAYSQIVKETQDYVKKHHRYNSIEDFSLAHAKTVQEIMAEKLYALDYRKIPEDSVVLSREEYDKLHSTINRLRRYDEERDIILHARLVSQARKETAENIFQRLFEKHSAFSNNDIIVIWQVKEVLRDIAKQFGVEV